MFKPRTLTLASLLFAIVVPTTIALAQPGGQGEQRREKRGEPLTAEQREERAQERFENLKQNLTKGVDLTAEQTQQINAALANFHEKAKAWHEAHREELTALRDQFRDAREDRDRDTLKSLHEQMKAIGEDRPKLRDDLKPVMQSLDDSQREQIRENIHEMRENAEHRFGKRHQRGEGEGKRPRGPRSGDGPSDD